MDENERAALLQELAQSTSELETEIHGLTPAQATYRSGEARWSILECVEHIALTESGMFQLLTTRAMDGRAAKTGREHKFARAILDRSRNIPAPDHVQPRGAHTTLDEAWSDFQRRRQQTIDYVAHTDHDLNERHTMHPVAGEISCRECLSLLMGHPNRHVGQIREIKQDPGYPTS